MADLLTHQGSPTEPRPPEDRGTLDVRVTAIRRIVERACLEVPGTVAHATALGRVRGTNSPHATVQVQGRSARVEVRVACVWPAPMSTIAVRVRDAVLRETPRLSGVPVATVDVTAYAVDPSDTTTTERRRVE